MDTSCDFDSEILQLCLDAEKNYFKSSMQNGEGTTKRRPTTMEMVEGEPAMKRFNHLETPSTSTASMSTFQNFSENTFKSYYYPEITDEASEDEGTLAYKVKKARAEKRSNNNIDVFFNVPNKKKKIANLSSVARASNGGVSYISTKDDGYERSHIVKIEVYDVKKIKNVPAKEQWKHAEVRVKYYTTTEDDEKLNSVRDIIYDITKELASKDDSTKYFLKTEK